MHLHFISSASALQPQMSFSARYTVVAREC
jgi:hypothetical protein